LDHLNYTVLIKDAEGNLGKTSTISVVNACLTVTATATNTTCNQQNGTITATATGGTPPYQYSIDGIHFQSNNVFNQLQKGSYTVSVKDAAGDIKTTVARVDNILAVTFTTVFTPVTCNGNDGSIAVNATGGTAPLMYSVDGTHYQTSNTISGLAAASYATYVKDANGCVAKSCCTTLPVYCLIISANATAASCDKNDGSVTVTATNGQLPYQYSIDGMHFQASPEFTDLAAADYLITVKDVKGSVVTKSVTVPLGCLQITANTTAATCGNANGSIKITVTNGKPPYRYSIDGSNFKSGNSFAALVPGNYTITVKDANSLTGTSVAFINKVLPPQISAVATAASCNNGDGSIVASVTNGTAPFQYALGDGSFQNENVFTHLDTGSYFINIKDVNGCTATTQSTILVSNTLTADAGRDTTICEGATVELSAFPNGLQYEWTPILNLNNASLKSPIASSATTTKYYIKVSTAICTAMDSVTVYVHPAPIVNAGADSTICYGKSIQLNGSGGMQYKWSPVDYLSNSLVYNPISTPRSTVTYHLKATDQYGCTSIEDASVKIIVTPPAKLSIGNDTIVAISQPLQLRADDVNHSGFTNFSWL